MLPLRALLLAVCTCTLLAVPSGAQQAVGGQRDALNPTRSDSTLPAPAGVPQAPASRGAATATTTGQQEQPYGHKPLGPLAPNDVALVVLSAVALFIASGAGVGGGGC